MVLLSSAVALATSLTTSSLISSAERAPVIIGSSVSGVPDAVSRAEDWESVSCVHTHTRKDLTNLYSMLVSYLLFLSVQRDSQYTIIILHTTCSCVSGDTHPSGPLPGPMSLPTASSSSPQLLSNCPSSLKSIHYRGKTRILTRDIYHTTWSTVDLSSLDDKLEARVHLIRMLVLDRDNGLLVLLSQRQLFK